MGLWLAIAFCPCVRAGEPVSSDRLVNIAERVWYPILNRDLTAYGPRVYRVAREF
jgi:hypothetical protein